jgi:hypothetical protein
MDVTVAIVVVILVLILIWLVAGWDVSLSTGCLTVVAVVTAWGMSPTPDHAHPIITGQGDVDPSTSVDYETQLAELSGQCEHLHQEATRRVIESLTGERFVELSAAYTLPTGDRYRNTRDVLPYWHKPDGVFLDMDGWNGHLRVGWEYQGPVHKQSKVQANDEIKRRLAKKHGIRWLVVDYRIPPSKLSRWLVGELGRLRVPLVGRVPKPLSQPDQRQIQRLLDVV